METLTCRFLDPASTEDLHALQALHFAAPDYNRIVHGRDPDGREALDTLTALPPGHDPRDKFVLGFELGGQLVGCADVLRGYPASGIAFLGLLLFAESHQGRGLGREALARVEDLAREWDCPVLRLGVITTNVRAHAFWLREGFTEVGRKLVPDATGPAIVMERPVTVPDGKNPITVS